MNQTQHEIICTQQGELAELQKRLSQVEKERDDLLWKLKNFGVIELATVNVNLASYIREWEPD